MKIRLCSDIQIPNPVKTLKKGSIQHAKFLGGLWLRGLVARPLRDHEWELFLSDEELQREFPPVER